MQLYTGISGQFIERAVRNELASELAENFARYLGCRPSESEVQSWVRSLRELAYRLSDCEIVDAGMVVEYRLPQTSRRLDAMLIGGDSNGRQRAVIVELKQWDRAYSTGIEDTVSFSPGSRQDLHLHPSAQARGYAEYLALNHTAFYSDEDDDFIALESCAYCHDAHSRTCGDLLSDEFERSLSAAPLFTQDMVDEIEGFLKQRVGHMDGSQGLKAVLNSRFLPSRRLLDHVADMIQGNPVYALLDEQQVVFNAVLSKVRELDRSAGQAVVIVRGGPGTGKSVIAMRLVAELARQHRTVVHATGSKAFTTNLRASVGRKAATLFKYFNSFADEDPGTIDVLVADEAHRIRESSNSRYTPRSRRSTRSQVEELMDVAKVSVFLLDDNQVVRPGEIGTPEMIRETANRRGAELWEIDLRAQFRCSGSESYVRWIDWVFGLGGEPDLNWRFGDGGHPEYDFTIVDSPHELERHIRERAKEGSTARLVAGFCWPWSDPRPDGSLVDDVVIGEWRRPWNRKETGNTPAERHPYTIWATQPEGLDEVGCIYSAQGFEFDYCGVIFGSDLVRRGGEWIAQPGASYDTVVKRSLEMARQLRNTYRVLLTRGMKGTYVYFTDTETRRFFQAAISLSQVEG